jgi:hypothetical protein
VTIGRCCRLVAGLALVFGVPLAFAVVFLAGAFA